MNFSFNCPECHSPNMSTNYNKKTGKVKYNLCLSCGLKFQCKDGYFWEDKK